MKKQIFIVRGVSNSGKTHTVRWIAEKLVVRYMGKHRNSINIAEIKMTVDVLWGTVKSEELSCIITFEYARKTVLVGICTAGDTIEIVSEKIGELVGKGCDIIVCGCKGVEGNHDKVFDDILNTAKGYVPHSETTCHTKEEPENPVDEKIAESILDSICDLLDDEFSLPKGTATFIHP